MAEGGGNPYHDDHGRFTSGGGGAAGTGAAAAATSANVQPAGTSPLSQSRQDMLAQMEGFKDAADREMHQSAKGVESMMSGYKGRGPGYEGNIR